MIEGVTRLLELQAIYELKARRDYSIDTKDWDLYASLHADDFVAEHLGSDPIIGGQVVADFLRNRLEGVTTIHHSHTPEAPRVFWRLFRLSHATISRVSTVA